MTIFGSDNQIDGLVLDVLLRKHEAIRKATGVSVPVPDSNQAVVEALMEGLLLRGVDSVQEAFDLGLDTRAQDLEREWESAAERERQSQTKYAQYAIHPEAVAAELREMREGTGTREEVASFVRAALTSLGSQVKPTDEGFTATLAALPARPSRRAAPRAPRPSSVPARLPGRQRRGRPRPHRCKRRCSGCQRP